MVRESVLDIQIDIVNAELFGIKGLQDEVGLCKLQPGSIEQQIQQGFHICVTPGLESGKIPVSCCIF